MDTLEPDRDKPKPQLSDRNIRNIAELERRALEDRSPADRLSDMVARVTGSGWYAAGNFVLFAGWILVNTSSLSGIEPFDPFPFSVLTLVCARACPNRLNTTSPRDSAIRLVVVLPILLSPSYQSVCSGDLYQLRYPLRSPPRTPDVQGLKAISCIENPDISTSPKFR